MSSSLQIPINAPLCTQCVIEKTKEALHELLQIPTIPELQAKIWHGNISSLDVPPSLTLESDLIFLYLDDLHPIILMVLDLSDDESGTEVFLDVEAKGTGGDPIRIILAAACAIAVARELETIIEDVSLAWSSKFESKPDELLSLLKCRSKHDNLESAFTEALENWKRNRPVRL